MEANLALDAALALARTPTLIHVMRKQPLPSGIPTLLRIVAGEEPAMADAVRLTRCEPGHLRTAVELYIQQVMLFAGAGPQRILGLTAGGSRADARTHMRWLMTWLHPDKNAAEWRSAFASRVLSAWRDHSGGAGVSSSTSIVAQRPAQTYHHPTGVHLRGQAGGRVLRGGRVPWVIRPLAEQPLSRTRPRLGRVGRALGFVVIAGAVIFAIDLAQPYVSAWLMDEPDLNSAVTRTHNTSGRYDHKTYKASKETRP